MSGRMRLSLGFLLAGVALVVASFFLPRPDVLQLAAVGFYIVSMMVALQAWEKTRRR